jgi:hypothetical protein
MKKLLGAVIVVGVVVSCGPMDMLPDGGSGSAGGLSGTGGGSTGGGSAGGVMAGGSAGGAMAGGSAGGATAGGSAGGATAGGSAGGSTAGGSAGGSTAGGSAGGAAGGSAGGAGGGTAMVSFSQEIAPILSSRCASCHGTFGATGTAYTRLTGMTGGGPCSNRPRMVPGNATMSLVYQKITNTQNCGDQMPRSGLLPQAQRDLIRDWINQGANNN